MINPTGDWRDAFCGRQPELAQLLKAYDEVAANEGPKLVVVLGDRGMGKTRLVQELYRLLTTTRDPDNYWPDASLFAGDNLRVAPETSDPLVRAHFESFSLVERRMPFLWWGFRLSDPDVRNAMRSDMAAHRATLEPHLGPLRFERLLAAKRRELAGVGVDVVSDLGKKVVVETIKQVPGVGFIAFVAELFLDHAEAAKRTVEAVHDGNELKKDLFHQTALKEDSRRAIDIHERTLEDLGALLAKTNEGPDARIPCVVFCDDAQFACNGGDEGARYFIEQLWQRSKIGGWPLLLILTHWTLEWEQAGTPDPGATLAGSLAIDASDPGIGRRLELSGEEKLIDLIRAGLADLAAEDCQLLLDKADGNPQVAIELVHLARRSPAWRQKEGGLFTASARTQILNHNTNLAGLIHDRMLSVTTPDSVRQAAAIASVQGMEFLNSLTNAAATSLHIEKVDRGLIEARDQHRLIVDIEGGVLSFVQRAYREAAERLLGSHVADPAAVQQIVLDQVISLVDDPRKMEGLTQREQLSAMGVLAGLAEQHEDHSIRVRGGRALLYLMHRATYSQDVALAATYSRRFELGLGLGDRRSGCNAKQLWKIEDFSLDDLTSVYLARRAWDGPRDLLPFVAALCDSVRREAEKSDSSVNSWNLGAALKLMGDVLYDHGDLAAAEAYFVESCEACRTLLQKTATDDSRQALAAIMTRVGDVRTARGDVAGSRLHYIESLELIRSVKTQTETMIYRENLADLIARVAGVFQDSGDWVSAESHYMESLEIKRGLMEELDIPKYRESVAGALLWMGC